MTSTFVFLQPWQAAVLLSTLLTGCGGGAGDAQPTTPSASGVPASGISMPTQTATTATDRTALADIQVTRVEQVVPGKSDYTLSAIHCNNRGPSAAVVARVGYADAGSEVLDNAFTFSPSSFGHCSVSTSAPRLRLDNATPFDAAKLQLSVTTTTPRSDNALQFTKLDIYRVAGRAGHEGLFALNNQYPEANLRYTLKAYITGASAVNHEVITPDGQVLTAGSLAAHGADDPGVFETALTAPTRPFQIRLVATSTGDTRIQWTTDTYWPQSNPLQVKLGNGVFSSRNQVLGGEITGTFAATGALQLRLIAPPGFSTDWTEKTVAGSSGDPIAVPFQLRTAADEDPPHKAKLHLQYRQPSGSEALATAKMIGALR